MKNKFSKLWNSSVQPRKQRKFLVNAPLHIKRRAISSHLSPELRKKYQFRSFGLKKGDKVKIMRGQHKGTEDKVSRIDTKSKKVYLEKIQNTRTDGNVVSIPLKCSNLMIIDLNLSDKKRKAKLESKIKSDKKTTK